MECDYCGFESKPLLCTDRALAFVARDDEGNPQLSFVTALDPHRVEQVKINRCPMCGRDLTAEYA